MLTGEYLVRAEHLSYSNVTCARAVGIREDAIRQYSERDSLESTTIRALRNSSKENHFCQTYAVFGDAIHRGLGT